MRRLPTFVLLVALSVACKDQQTAASGPKTSSETTSGAAAETAAFTTEETAAATAKASAMLEAGDFEGLSAYLANAESKALLGGTRAVLAGAIALGDGDIPTAELVLRDYHAAHPEDVAVSMQLSEIYMTVGYGQKAVDVLERTIAKAPDDCDLHFRLGVIHGRGAHLKEAETAFLAAEKCGLESPDLEYNLALLAQQQGQFEASTERFRRLLKVQPNLRSARRELARNLIQLASDEQLVEAQELLDGLNAESEEDWMVWELLALQSEASGDLEAAQLYLVEALRVGKNQPQTEQHYVRVGRALIDSGHGELVPLKEKNEDMPPISAAMQERFDEAAAKKRERLAREAEQANAGAASEGEEQSGSSVPPK